MNKYLFCIILFFSLEKIHGQECNCEINFKFMIEKVKKNYVGYKDKVTILNQNKLDFFTDSLYKVAKKADKYECTSICQQWIGFFKDKHMFVGIDPAGYSEDVIRSFYVNDKSVGFTESSFLAYLKSNKDKLDSVEGIWTNSSWTYTIGVVQNHQIKGPEKVFTGFILKADSIYWLPKQIKWEITKRNNNYITKYFRSKDHSYEKPALTKNNDTLDFGIYGKWYKNQQKVTVKRSVKQNVDLSPKFKILDNKTCLFLLPSFGDMNYINKMDSIIEENDILLKKTEHLIIDIRNNLGGSVLIYEKLMPYLYTNAILTEGASILATQDNINDGYSEEHPQLSDSMQKELKKKLEMLKINKDQLYNAYPVDTIKFDKVLKYPQRISILINRSTGSAAELFLLEAKQSKKVKVYGENSAGAVDYTEFIKSKMPCNFYVLYYPASRSNRLPEYPLDNIGITPDIKIPAEISDWIDYVRKH